MFVVIFFFYTNELLINVLNERNSKLTCEPLTNATVIVIILSSINQRSKKSNALYTELDYKVEILSCISFTISFELGSDSLNFLTF